MDSIHDFFLFFSLCLGPTEPSLARPYPPMIIDSPAQRVVMESEGVKLVENDVVLLGRFVVVTNFNRRLRLSRSCGAESTDARFRTRRPSATRLCADGSRTFPWYDVLFGVTYEKLERYRED